MVEQITKGIRISVTSHFEGTFYKEQQINFAFGYNITIENQSPHSVQLLSRHWEILDALNIMEIVDGKGVIGQQPILQPGELHTYSSGCLLSAPFGAMRGYYTMTNFTTGNTFKVRIPTFKLHSPFALN
ncbi:Co2+/Mg2+ efflux protein ApaG [Flavimarina sp. Hel_I_48]|uniref:Co2+/Mg2+ efflux protein ApaG n=1 Tax=Flavimarina sp. Hel_I_48 TaxID=1392488 RepID=UPI0004DEEE77|nr:Co2+/Mg2+ efflux protein ApaG [Flavimarina sp. Hel_I_48]